MTHPFDPLCKTLLLVFFMCYSLNHSMYGQEVSGKIRQETISYSHEYIKNVLVVYQHSGYMINAYYTIQNEQKPDEDLAKNIIRVDYIKAGSELALNFSDQSSVIFSTKADHNERNRIACFGIGHNYNNEGYSKEHVRNVVASFE